MINVVKNADGTLTITVDNGDVAALSNIQQSWGFKDEASVLKFAIGALTNAKNQKLYVDVDDNGTKGFLVVREDFKANTGTPPDGTDTPATA